jgi:hypothetical protein
MNWVAGLGSTQHWQKLQNFSLGVRSKASSKTNNCSLGSDLDHQALSNLSHSFLRVITDI